MKTKNIIKLMLKSSNDHPYYGKLSTSQNIKAAIELAELCKQFADDGRMDEAMHIESKQWIEVISELKSNAIKYLQMKGSK